MKQYGCSICFLLLFALPPAHCQQLLFRNYTIQDGLVANPVRAIFQDTKGFIWVATWEGLSKYDGYKFTNFNTANGLSHNLVNDFFEADGQLYVAENDGTIDAICNNRVQKIFKAPTAINHFFQVNKNITLFTTDGDGIYEFREKKFSRPAQNLEKFPLDRLLQVSDSMFLGHAGEEIMQLFSTKYQLYAAIKLRNVYLGGLYKDSRQRIWACTSAGLKLLSPSLDKKEPLSFSSLPAGFTMPLIAQGIVTDILEDTDGSFWIATHKGLVRLEKSGSYQLYTEMNGLPSKIITTLFRDRENNIWIGTKLGLAKYTGKSDIRNLKNDVTGVVALPNGDLLMCTPNGLQRYHKKQNRFVSLFSTAAPVFPAFVKGSTPTLVYYGNTIVRLDTSRNRVEGILKSPLTAYSDLASCTDKQGISFIGCANGIAVLTKKKWYVSQSLPYRITSLAIDKEGYLWAGTWQEGLYRIRYISTADSLLFATSDFTPLINSKQIRSLFGDSKGNIWVGTRYNGAFELTPVAKDQYEVKNFEKPQGIISNFITSFGETPEGEIWVGSYQGIDKLVRDQNRFRVFNFSTVTNFFSQVGALLPDTGGGWYCIANSNLFWFTDNHIEQMQPPQIHVLSALLGKANDKDHLLSSPAPTSLPYNQNGAKFVFSALSFINEKQILYSYRLKGSGDTAWSKPQNVHEVSYASLSPGDYLFEVRSLGWDGRAGRPAAFSFTIRPPFWQTAWFYVSCIVALAALFYFLYRYRIHQLLKWQKARDRIATDLHDDIGSTLTNISILSELSYKNRHQPEKAEQFLQRISEEVHTSSQAMDDIIWSVNSRHDSLEETLARMRRYAADLFDNSPIQCHLQLSENGENMKLGMEQRRDLYLIYKESLNNIYKHAEAKNIWVTVQHNHQWIHLSVKDDGKGFDTQAPTHRNGLRNVRARAEKWKGSVEISSTEEKGTNIEVAIPIAG